MWLDLREKVAGGFLNGTPSCTDAPLRGRPWSARVKQGPCLPFSYASQGLGRSKRGGQPGHGPCHVGYTFSRETMATGSGDLRHHR